MKIVIIRGALVLGWITVLSIIALAALRGTASRSVLGIEPVPVRGLLTTEVLLQGLTQEGPRPIVIYEQWRTTYRGATPMAPVSAVLDEMWPKWETTPRDRDPEAWVVNWEQSFNRIERWLVDLAAQRDGSSSSYAISFETVPAAFRGEINYAEFTRLPRTAITWIEERRTETANTAKLLELANAGIFALVLGAFGGVLFLLRSLAGAGVPGVSVTLSTGDFFFRPLVGALLALALLVADIVIHTVLSTGNVLQVRQEPMYILALAAGFLSDKAYLQLEKMLDTGIRNKGLDASAPVPQHVEP